jgi:hypothetical protein
MKPILRLAFFAAFVYLQGCGGCIKKSGGTDQDQASKSKSKFPVPVATDNLTVTDVKDLTGYWTGLFGPAAADSLDDAGDYEPGFNKINISIDEIDGTKVKGHTVIAGKVRFFHCELKKNGSKFTFRFVSGADDKADGVFKFGITEGDSLMKGSWNTNSRNVVNHEYALTKKHFAYDADWKLQRANYVDYSKSATEEHKADSGETYQESKFATTSDDVEKINASASLLKKEDVANLKKADFLIIRNSIFARHGYTFKKPLLSFYFSQQPWYVPLSNDVTADITPIEKKNLALMSRYEKNAQEYYNAFGR